MLAELSKVKRVMIKPPCFRYKGDDIPFTAGIGGIRQGKITGAKSKYRGKEDGCVVQIACRQRRRCQRSNDIRRSVNSAVPEIGGIIPIGGDDIMVVPLSPFREMPVPHPDVLLGPNSESVLRLR